MDIDYYINRHFANRRKGFYFWTTKKNFLSTYIFTKYSNDTFLDKGDIFVYFRYIFDSVISKIKMENGDECKKKCIAQWESYRFRALCDDHYDNDPIIFLKNVQPRNLLHFLYKNAWSIEEFFAYVSPNVDLALLLRIALKTFSYIENIVDLRHSTWCDIRFIKVYYPISSLYTNKVLYTEWNHLLQ